MPALQTEPGRVHPPLGSTRPQTPASWGAVVSDAGYPRIEAREHYSRKHRRLEILFQQTRHGPGGHFHVPVEIAAVDESGRDIPGTAQVVELTSQRRKVVLENMPEPAFVSYNRDSSFYGTFVNGSALPAKLVKQIRL